MNDFEHGLETDGDTQVLEEVMYSLRAYGGNHLGMFAGTRFWELLDRSNRPMEGVVKRFVAVSLSPHKMQLTLDKIRGSSAS